MSDFLTLQGAKDLNTDAIHISAVANSVDPVTGAPIDEHVNRMGGTDYTFKGLLGAIGPVVMPWTSITGGTLTQPNQAFLHPANGNYYSWAGAYPVGGYVVAPGTDPTLPGSGYVPRIDVALRNELESENGVNLIGNAHSRFSSVAEMVASTALDGMISTTAGYYSLADGGGAQYVYSASSTALADGFLVHTHAAGGRWLLVDNRSRLPMQVAGAKVDGVTDDRTAFLAALASKRRLSLSGDMRVSGAAIDLSAYVTSQRLGVDILGDDPSLSSISFTGGSGGLVASAFFRGLTLRNLTIKNASLDKTGVGFSTPNGAELIDLVNVTFTGWRCGHNTHCWNSSMRNVTSRGCYYAGAYRGTSYHGASFYANTCDFGHCLGFAFNTSTNLIEVNASVRLSYTTICSFAADQCGVPYLIGRCYNLKIQSCGAERSTGAYVIDATQATVTSRQLVVIDALDLYVQSADGTTTIVNTAANMNNSLMVKDTRVYSDKSIPLCSGSGKGVMFDNVRYNSSGVKTMTTTNADGVTISSPVIIGSDPASLSKTGFEYGGYNQLRQVKAVVPMVVSATSKVVIRLQDTSATGLANGICAFGRLNFYPVHKSAGNAGRDCGTAVFSVAADYAGGLSSINLQKLGTLTSLTAENRQSGTVQEMAFTLTAATVQYMCEMEFWCNGKFASSFIDYYTE